MKKIKRTPHIALNLPSLRLEGHLFLPDQLEQAALGRAEGQSEADYCTPKGLKLKDDYSRAFQIANAQWKHFAAQLGRHDIEAHNVTITFVLELLRDALGYQNLQAVSGINLGGRLYPVSLMAGNVLVVVAPHDLELDVSDERFAIVGSGSRKKSAFQLAQEFLNASPDHLWALVSNGKQLRLLRDAETLTRPSYLEVDFQDLLSGQRFAEFAMAWRLLHASRAGQPGSARECIWEVWRSAGQEQGTRVREGLREGVTRALLTLGNGFLQHSANEALRRDLQEARLNQNEFFQQLLRLVYRLIFLFTVEERGLLHPSDDSAEAQRARSAYAAGYALARLREVCLRRRLRTRFDDLWQCLRIVFKGLSTGEPRLALPALGGIFASSQCSTLDTASLTNADFLLAIRHLRWAATDGILAPVDYRNMGPEELGSVYESLLELVPEVDVPARQFGFIGMDNEGNILEATRGTDRKETGSYYTPDSLVQELIKSALEPVIEQRLADHQNNPAEALLNIKVIDPACGSGHFLLAAARRLAERLAALRSSEGAIKPQDYRHALREVIGSCIFGVDRNPMALELCRTALWLEGFEEGKPLSFLDHHLQCGDSLLGLTDLKVLESGIPADAFKPICDDDKATCQQLAKANKLGLAQLERDLKRGQQIMRFDVTSGLAELQALEALPNETQADITARANAWDRFCHETDASRLTHAADLLLGAFVLSKTEDTASSIPTSQTLYLELFSDNHNAQHKQQLAAARQACKEARVLHWPLAFPQVFQQGGFDCVLGNPPWEIVQARNDVIDEEMLARQKKWFSEGIYSLLSGRRDLYKLFLVMAKRLLNPRAYCGFVIPIGFLFEDDCADLRKELFDKGSVISVLHIQNAQKAFFPDVHASYRFLAITFSNFLFDSHRFSAVVRTMAGLSSPPWHEVRRSEFDLILGTERSAALFNDLRQVETHQNIMARISAIPLLKYRIAAEFHASSDKDLLEHRRKHDSDRALLKNGSFHHFYPGFGPVEKYVRHSEIYERLVRKGLDPNLWIENPRLVFRDIARNDDTRTLIPCLVPAGFVSTYDAPMIVPEKGEQCSELALAFYAGYLSSFLVDFLIRPFVDKHIKGYVLARVPIPEFNEANPLMIKAAEISLALAKEGWKACKEIKKPRGSEHTFEDRITLDATYLRILRIKEEEIDVIFDEFKAIKLDEIKKLGEYRTRRLVLREFDRIGLANEQIVPVPYSPQGIIRDKEDARFAGLIWSFIREANPLTRQQLTMSLTIAQNPDNARSLLSPKDFGFLTTYHRENVAILQSDRLDRTQSILRFFERVGAIRFEQQGLLISAVPASALPAGVIIERDMPNMAGILLRASQIALQQNPASGIEKESQSSTKH